MYRNKLKIKQKKILDIFVLTCRIFELKISLRVFICLQHFLLFALFIECFVIMCIVLGAM